MKPPCSAIFPSLRHHPELRSGERCDRGSDPPVTPSKARLATEGLTQCRAQLNEAPVLHRSDTKRPSRHPYDATLPPIRPSATAPPLPPFRPAASFPPLQGVRPAVASRVNSVAHRVRPLPPPVATSRCHTELRSGERCDRGSDPTVTPSKARLATEGLTQCRATLHEAPVLHTSDTKRPSCHPSVPPPPPFRPSAAAFPLLRRLLSDPPPPPVRPSTASFPPLHCLLSDPPLPPFRPSAASFPSLQGVRPAVASRVNSVAHRVRPLPPPVAAP